MPKGKVSTYSRIRQSLASSSDYPPITQQERNSHVSFEPELPFGQNQDKVYVRSKASNESYSSTRSTDSGFSYGSSSMRPTQLNLKPPVSPTGSLGNATISPGGTVTKRIDQVVFESPNAKYGGASSPWSTPPEFLKTFPDQTVPIGGRLEWECIMFGNPRPRVTWYLNGVKLEPQEEIDQINTCDNVKLVIRKVLPHHYGQYQLVVDNEAGQANCSAFLRRP